MIQILLVIPVAIAFYYIGKWLKESEKRDDEKRKTEENITPRLQIPKNDSELKRAVFHTLNIVLIIVIVIVVLYFFIGWFTNYPGYYNPGTE